MNAAPDIPEGDISISFVRSAGPGEREVRRLVLVLPRKNITARAQHPGVRRQPPDLLHQLRPLSVEPCALVTLLRLLEVRESLVVVRALALIDDAKAVHCGLVILKLLHLYLPALRPCDRGDLDETH